MSLLERFGRNVNCVDCSYLWTVQGPLRQRMTRSLLGTFDRDHGKVYVIVDDGMGTGQKFCAQLRSAGIRRYYVLMGGEDALRTKGVSERRTR